MKNRNYSVISNRHIFQKNMSWQAKGMLDAMLSVPDDWHFSIEGLVQMSSNGRASVRAILQELTDLGYIRIEQGRNDKGQITSVYYIYEIPIEPKSGNEENDDPSQRSAPSGSIEGASGNTKMGPVSAMCENRTWSENLTTSENRTRSKTPRNSVSETSVSTGCENRTRLETSVSPGSISRCGFSDAENRTQSNTNIKYINNNIYTSCAPNEDKIDHPSVSPCGTKTEEDVLASLKERIGYDRLIDQGYPRQTLELLIDVMLEVYRTDKRQMRCAGLLRSVKDIRERLDQLDSAHVAHVLDCYLSFDGTVERPRPYLRTALFNALVSYNEDHRTKHLSSEGNSEQLEDVCLSEEDWENIRRAQERIRALKSPDRMFSRS